MIWKSDLEPCLLSLKIYNSVSDAPVRRFAGTVGSRQVPFSGDSTAASSNKYRSPLASRDTTNIKVPKERIEKLHKLKSELKQEMLIIIDDVGVRMKDSQKLQVVCKPAANHFVISEMFKNGNIRTDNAHIAIHVGTNSVLDFRRHRVITEVLQLIEEIRKNTSAWIYLSSLVPRPIDHQDTAYKIRDFNHAIKKAVQVAQNSGKTGVIYVSNQQLYILDDGQLNLMYFHKKQLALSKAGIACLKNNLFTRANIKL